MTEYNSFDEILAYAIEREQQAQEFYIQMAARTKFAHMREVFESFAREEAGHKARLQGMKSGARQVPPLVKVQDLKLADYRDKIAPTDDMSYDRVLLLAMQREKAAFKLYTDLAGVSADEATRSLFLALAQEEARHKLRFELEYDREYMGEN